MDISDNGVTNEEFLEAMKTIYKATVEALFVESVNSKTVYGKKKFRHLFEQWVEDFEGQEHMYKLVSSKYVDEDGIANCKGCCFGSSNRLGEHCCNYAPYPEATCPVEQGKNGIVIDLGILNDEGCLPASWNRYIYPYIEETWKDHEHCWTVYVSDRHVSVRHYGNTKQEAIDAWNWRTL